MDEDILYNFITEKRSIVILLDRGRPLERLKGSQSIVCSFNDSYHYDPCGMISTLKWKQHAIFRHRKKKKQ